MPYGATQTLWVSSTGGIHKLLWKHWHNVPGLGPCPMAGSDFERRSHELYIVAVQNQGPLAVSVILLLHTVEEKMKALI